MALIDIGKILSTYCSGIDLALLSMADVSLLTYGSFGDFGAILYKDKKEVRTVLTRLCESENFVRVIPVLVLKGNKDIAYELIQSHKNTMGIG